MKFIFWIEKIIPGKPCINNKHEEKDSRGYQIDVWFNICCRFLIETFADIMKPAVAQEKNLQNYGSCILSFCNY